MFAWRGEIVIMIFVSLRAGIGTQGQIRLPQKRKLKLGHSPELLVVWETGICLRVLSGGGSYSRARAGRAPDIKVRPDGFLLHNLVFFALSLGGASESSHQWAGFFFDRQVCLT